MSFDRINRLIDDEQFYFQAWSDRFGWVLAGLGTKEGEIDPLRDFSQHGICDATCVTDHVLHGDWLPYVTGKTIYEAMEKLEAKLAALPQDQLQRGSQWAVMVEEAIGALTESIRGKSHYDHNKPEPNYLKHVPATFELALEQRNNQLSGAQ